MGIKAGLRHVAKVLDEIGVRYSSICSVDVRDSGTCVHVLSEEFQRLAPKLEKPTGFKASKTTDSDGDLWYHVEVRAHGIQWAACFRGEVATEFVRTALDQRRQALGTTSGPGSGSVRVLEHKTPPLFLTDGR